MDASRVIEIFSGGITVDDKQVNLDVNASDKAKLVYQINPEITTKQVKEVLAGWGMTQVLLKHGYSIYYGQTKLF